MLDMLHTNLTNYYPPLEQVSIYNATLILDDKSMNCSYMHSVVTCLACVTGHLTKLHWVSAVFQLHTPFHSFVD